MQSFEESNTLEEQIPGIPLETAPLTFNQRDIESKYYGDALMQETLSHIRNLSKSNLENIQSNFKELNKPGNYQSILKYRPSDTLSPNKVQFQPDVSATTARPKKKKKFDQKRFEKYLTKKIYNQECRKIEKMEKQKEEVV